METFNLRTPDQMKTVEENTVWLRFRLPKSDFTTVKRMSASANISVDRFLRNVISDYLRYVDSKSGNA